MVCIPTYNAESTISEAVKRCKEFADLVLVVDDGSTDNSESVAREAGAEILSHKINLGYGGAIKSGLAEALKRKVQVTITFDADLQHDSQDLPKLINPILSNSADIVIGSRFLERNDHVKPYRKFGIKLITKIVNSFSILVNQIDGLDGNSLQSAALNLTSHLGNKAIVILGGIPNPENRKLLFVVSLGDDAVKIGLHAGKLINEIARICSGGGGGKPNFAQAGAKDIDKLSDALDYGKNYLQKTLDSYSDK